MYVFADSDGVGQVLLGIRCRFSRHGFAVETNRCAPYEHACLCATANEYHTYQATHQLTTSFRRMPWRVRTGACCPTRMSLTPSRWIYLGLSTTTHVFTSDFCFLSETMNIQVILVGLLGAQATRSTSPYPPPTDMPRYLCSFFFFFSHHIKL